MVQMVMMRDDRDAVWDSECPKASDNRNALQVLYNYMSFSRNGQHSQQKLNALKL